MYCEIPLIHDGKDTLPRESIPSPIRKNACERTSIHTYLLRRGFSREVMLCLEQGGFTTYLHCQRRRTARCSMAEKFLPDGACNIDTSLHTLRASDAWQLWRQVPSVRCTLAEKGGRYNIREERGNGSEFHSGTVISSVEMVGRMELGYNRSRTIDSTLAEQTGIIPVSRCATACGGCRFALIPTSHCSRSWGRGFRRRCGFGNRSRNFTWVYACRAPSQHQINVCFLLADR